MQKTLFEKIWDEHVVRVGDDGVALLYVDLHLVHEITSPQAFEGLRLEGRRVRRPELTVATMDHAVPTLPVPSRTRWRRSSSTCFGPTAQSSTSSCTPPGRAARASCT